MKNRFSPEIFRLEVVINKEIKRCSSLKINIMKKNTLLILSVLISTLLISCGNSQEVSKSEFIDNVLPKVEINNVEIRNNEIILIHTNENKPYKIKDVPPYSIDDFLNEIISKNEKISVHYTNESNGNYYILSIFQLFSLIIPFLILAHIILLWISLRRIIKSEIDNMEKMVYTIISIFFPFFGSIIYLTTKKP
jgi:ATP-dependent Zn protease